MNQEKIMKKLYNYLYNCRYSSEIISHYNYFKKCDISVISLIENIVNRYKSYNNIPSSWLSDMKVHNIALSFIRQHDIPEDVVLLVYINSQNDKQNLHKKMRKVEKIIKRDNKCIRNVGSLHSNKNTVRYPRKARPLHVWKKFYELFPAYAERDNWNGKTSDKMK